MGVELETPRAGSIGGLEEELNLPVSGVELTRKCPSEQQGMEDGVGNELGLW